MPPRVSRSSISGGNSRPQQRGNKRRKQRGLNAYSIASEEVPEKSQTRRSRLGEIEDDGPRRKRQRLQDDDEDLEDSRASNTHGQRRNRTVGRHTDDADVSEGSDSEGHEWTMGGVREDDDSEVDSDEAFGESDEERFEDFSFRGSTSKSKRSLNSRPNKVEKEENEIDLGEGQDSIEEEEEDDDFGNEGIDLAQVLDDGEEGAQSSGSAASGSSESDEEREGGDETGSESNDEPEGKSQLLQDLIASLPKEDERESDDEAVSATLNAQNLLKSLQAMPNLDPSLGQSVKTLTRDITKSKDGQATTKVKVPLPKREQDRLDRAAAYEKAKETLNRWVDTVKHNRRAEHLTFPLPDPSAQEPHGGSRMVPTAGTKPRNDLEDAINSILQSSGFADAGSKSEENKLKAAEDLETKALPLEDVMAKRAELRKQRDLLFREEKRAKRIKKIKSKAYRRVHRREKEREAQKERDLMAAAGVEIPEEEQEAIDRRRAEERMGARHKESRWAKGVKQTRRGAWDEDARSGVAEMARRNDQLRQRVAGNVSKDKGASDDDHSSEESSSGEEEGGFSLRDSLKQIEEDQDTNQRRSRLGSLKFMQRADAARRQQNDEATKQILKDVEGTAGDSESEEDNMPGRQLFGSTPKPTETQTKQRRPKLEFEEDGESNSEKEMEEAHVEEKESGFDIDAKSTSTKPGWTGQTKGGNTGWKPQNQRSSSAKSLRDNEGEKYHTQNLSNRRTVPAARSNHAQLGSQSDGNQINEAEDGPIEDADSTSLLPSNLELVQAAFGGDEVEADFAKEKQELIEDEDDKIVDNTLPGWGSWTGSGLSKRDKRVTAQKKASGRNTTTQAGVKAVDRKDAKLGDRVIISEKQVKKNQKYLAPVLPHPFESRQQYERSLRIPIGPEWTTKETFQSATKPRIMLKRGIIKPIQAPIL